MNSYFARHEVDKKGEGWGKDSAGYIAWLLWGGDAGWSWVKGILRDQEKKDKAMAQDFTTSYAEIIKYDKNDDGTITVYGKATSDDLDIDQQICDNDWLSKAMPEWFKSGGNIREQHSNIASGVATEYETKNDGHYIGALIVDPVSVKKVEAKVLKGFSIGIKGPRVVRDSKAANGRIVDGQIVEVSLVDRPANPSCQLVLAKSVAGESSLTQVEELIESTESVTISSNQSPVSETPVEKSALVETILELKKSATGDTVKFDQAAYDTARHALAQLIMVEAGEMAEHGSDERDSIEELLDALKHLFHWYEGETAEGETPHSSVAETLGLSAHTDAEKSDCECDCDSCEDGKGCDSKMCKCAMAKSTEVSKCLECGCHVPGATHGKDTVQIPGNNGGIATTANVSTAEVGMPKSAEGDEAAPAADAPADEAAPAAETPAEDVSATESLDDDAVAEIVEKAVKSATESVKAEIALLKSATKAAEEKAVALESELVTAKSAAVGGGPKRTGRTAVTQENELLLKATEYRVKAAATSDPILVKGYKALEKEYLSKAGKHTDEI
jgi:hypothetical protein